MAVQLKETSSGGLMTRFGPTGVSAADANINKVEQQIAEYIGCKNVAALLYGTAAVHLASKIAGEKPYGQARPNVGKPFS